MAASEAGDLKNKESCTADLDLMRLDLNAWLCTKVVLAIFDQLATCMLCTDAYSLTIMLLTLITNDWIGRSLVLVKDQLLLVLG